MIEDQEIIPNRVRIKIGDAEVDLISNDIEFKELVKIANELASKIKFRPETGTYFG